MRVLLTGASGFIGSHVARVLVRQGCDVHALVRREGDSWRIADLLDSLHLVRGDLLALDRLDPPLEEVAPEVCLHFAWYAVPGKYLTALENLDMLEASLRLTTRLTRVGCKRLVVAGTCFEYDTDFGYLAESTPTRPKSLYAACKLALHLAVSHLAHVTGLRTVWPRLFYQFGPLEDERRLVPSVILSLLRNCRFRTTSGEQIRDYLYVEDVAEALWAVTESKVEGPVNIGSGSPVAIRDIVRKIGEALGRPNLLDFETQARDPAFICADNRLLRDRTGWAPRYTLDEGLNRTIEWWRGRAGKRG
jgi:nucleoside-diphosphate-sugar epimerase